MPANVTSPEVKSLSARYPGMLGNLFSPGAWQRPFGPYALDNGRFTGSEWTPDKFWKLIETAKCHSSAPRWILCPDVVGDWPGTVREWRSWRPQLDLGWPVALAVQDGATVNAARALSPDVVFVGGTTEWKKATTGMWCALFPRVHVGRVNTVRRAWACLELGAESIDGTGWMRTTRQRKGLRTLLAMMAGTECTQTSLWREYGDHRQNL